MLVSSRVPPLNILFLVDIMDVSNLKIHSTYSTLMRLIQKKKTYSTLMSMSSIKLCTKTNCLMF